MTAERFEVAAPPPSGRVAEHRRGGASPGAAPVRRPRPAAHGEGKRIALLVDDDRKMAELLGRALIRIGFATSFAETGDAALVAMRRREPVAAVVLDLMIPHPDGLEVCRQLRRDRWDGPIVMISALDGPETRLRARRAGADVFLAKPFRLTELLDAVATLVDGAPHRPEGP